MYIYIHIHVYLYIHTHSESSSSLYTVPVCSMFLYHNLLNKIISATTVFIVHIVYDLGYQSHLNIVTSGQILIYIIVKYVIFGYIRLYSVIFFYYIVTSICEYFFHTCPFTIVRPVYFRLLVSTDSSATGEYMGTLSPYTDQQLKWVRYM